MTPARTSTAPVRQLLGSANAETTPQGTPAAEADRTQRPDATCKREERVTVQGPVKKLEPDGMSHGGGGGCGYLCHCRVLVLRRALTRERSHRHHRRPQPPREGVVACAPASASALHCPTANGRRRGNSRTSGSPSSGSCGRRSSWRWNCSTRCAPVSSAGKSWRQRRRTCGLRNRSPPPLPKDVEDVMIWMSSVTCGMCLPDGMPPVLGPAVRSQREFGACLRGGGGGLFVTERCIWSFRPLTSHFLPALFVLIASCAHVQ